MNLDKIWGFRSDHQFSKDFPLKIIDFDEFGQNLDFPQISIFKGFPFKINVSMNLNKISGFCSDHQFSKGFSLKIDDFYEFEQKSSGLGLIWRWSGIGLGLVRDWSHL